MSDDDPLKHLGLGDLDWDEVIDLATDANVQPVPDFEQSFRFQDQFESRANALIRKPFAGAQPIHIVPQRQGPWSASNQLGIEQHFAPDTNNQQTILKLDEWDMPKPWAIVLGLGDLEIGTTGFLEAVEITALINFGCGGVTQQVEIDWLNGSGIVVPANAINVIAKYNRLSSEAGATVIPPGLTLRVSLCQGAPLSLRPTRSYLHFPADPSPFIRIPPFAKNVTLSCVANVAPVTPFDYYKSHKILSFVTSDDGSGICTAAYELSQFVTSIDFTNEFVGCVQSVPVPPFARYLDLTNIDTTGLGSLVQFEIGI